MSWPAALASTDLPVRHDEASAHGLPGPRCADPALPLWRAACARGERGAPLPGTADAMRSRRPAPTILPTLYLPDLSAGALYTEVSGLTNLFQP